MGLDIYIYRCKKDVNKLTKEEWNEYYRADTDMYDCETMPIISEAFYARKFGELQDVIRKNYKDYELGQYLRLRRKDIEDMIQVAIITRNYFDNFESVPPLCEILDKFDEDEKMGWHYWYQCDVQFGRNLQIKENR